LLKRASLLRRRGSPKGRGIAEYVFREGKHTFYVQLIWLATALLDLEPQLRRIKD